MGVGGDRILVSSLRFHPEGKGIIDPNGIFARGVFEALAKLPGADSEGLKVLALTRTIKPAEEDGEPDTFEDSLEWLPMGEVEVEEIPELASTPEEPQAPEAPPAEVKDVDGVPTVEVTGDIAAIADGPDTTPAEPDSTEGGAATVDGDELIAPPEPEAPAKSAGKKSSK